jgi:hypothetical protein
MTHCAHCGEYLSVDEEWRLRPEIEPGTSELDVPEEYRGDEYMHPDCRDEYVQEELA